MSLKRGIISTYANGVDLVVEWKINNFFNLPEKDGTAYWSPEFSFGGERWYMLIGPNGSNGSDSYGHVDLNLYKCDSGRSIKQSFSLSLKTIRGEKYNERHFTKSFNNGNRLHEFNRFISRSELARRRSELVPEGVLTVVCTMKSSTSAGSAKCVETCTQIQKHIFRQASTQTVEEKYFCCREKLLMAVSIASILIVVVTGCLLAYSKAPLPSWHPCGDLVMSNKQLQEKIAQLEEVAETLKARESELNAIKKEHGELKCTYESIASEKNKLQHDLDSEKQKAVNKIQTSENNKANNRSAVVGSKEFEASSSNETSTTDIKKWESVNKTLAAEMNNTDQSEIAGYDIPEASAANETDTAETDESEPLPQPVLMVTEVGSTYLEVAWVLPEESKTNVAHNVVYSTFSFQHYIVHFRKYGTQWQEVCFRNVSRTSYSLTNLNPGMSYQIYVMAVYSRFSRPSEIATVCTSDKIVNHSPSKGHGKQLLVYAATIIILAIAIASVYGYSKTLFSALHPYGERTPTISAEEDSNIKADLSEVAETDELQASDSKRCATETEGPVTFNNVLEDCGFVSDINHLLKEKRGVDVTFELETPSGETKLFAHPLILAVMSSYFADEFYNKGINKGHQIIHLKGIIPKAFEQMIRYCYGENPIFETTEDVCALFKIAFEFKVISLQNLCHTFFRHTKIEPVNVFSILKISVEMEDKSLQDMCYQILQENTREVMATYELRHITPAMVYTLLKLPKLSLNSEYELINWIFNWAKVKSEDAREYLERLLKEMNFLALRFEEFAILCKDYEGFFNSDEIVSIYQNIALTGTREMPEWFNNDLKCRVYTGSNE